MAPVTASASWAHLSSRKLHRSARRLPALLLATVLLSGCQTHYAALPSPSAEQITQTRAALASGREASVDEDWPQQGRDGVLELPAEVRTDAPGHGQTADRDRTGSPARWEGDMLRLSEDQAVAFALEESQQMAASDAMLTVAKAQERDAVSMDGLELRAGPVHPNELAQVAPTIDLGLRVRPPHPLQLAAGANAARANTHAVEAEVERSRQAFGVEIRREFQKARFVEAELEVSRTIRGARRKLLSLAEARVAAGVAVQLDASMAELSLEEAEQHSLELEGERSRALSRLADRIGLPKGIKIELVYEPVGSLDLPTLPSEESLIDAALTGRPELKVVAAKRDAVASEVRLARSRLLPGISFLQLGYELAPASTIQDSQPWSLSAGVEIPIPGFNQAEVGTTRAKEQVAIRALNAEIERTVLEVRDGLRKAERAREALEAYRAGPVAAAERAGEEVARALDGSTVDLVRVALLEERSAEIRSRLIQLHRDYVEAYESLRAIVGGQLPR